MQQTQMQPQKNTAERSCEARTEGDIVQDDCSSLFCQHAKKKEKMTISSGSKDLANITEEADRRAITTRLGNNCKISPELFLSIERLGANALQKLQMNGILLSHVMEKKKAEARMDYLSG